jgi:hypothetical protein
MSKRPARTIFEVCVARGGVWKGAKVQTFIAQWTIASQALGRPITLAEYGEWWKDSRATIYRRQAEFRDLFPTLDSPQPIADAAMAQAAEWQASGVAGIGALPASLVPA